LSLTPNGIELDIISL